MKIKEIRALGINELKQKSGELMEELFRLKIQTCIRPVGINGDAGTLPQGYRPYQHGAEGKGGCKLTWLKKGINARSRA